MENLNEILSEVEELLEKHDFYSIKSLFRDMEPADIAAVLEEFPEKIGVLFRVLPKDLAAEPFVEMNSD